MFNWIKAKWAQFEAWIAKQIPTWKTKAIASLGFILSSAVALQDYITGLAGMPIEQWVSSKTLALINLGLFTLVFWLRGIANRVEARAQASS
jgi:hypothetical protein